MVPLPHYIHTRTLHFFILIDTSCISRSLSKLYVSSLYRYFFSIFQLLGLVFVILGFILRFGRVLYEPFLQTGIDQIKKVVTDTPLASFDTSDLDLGAVVQSLAIGLIVGGLFLCAISFVGCCGACYKIDCLLWIVSMLSKHLNSSVICH